MNLSVLLRRAAACSLLVPGLSVAELSGIDVRVANISPIEGTVEVSVFDSADSFMREPYLQQSGKPYEDGTFATRFVGLPDGDYAVVVVHDANDNGKLDAGFLGFGGEKFGYSNQVKQWFTRPEFEDTKISVTVPDTVVEVDLD